MIRRFLRETNPLLEGMRFASIGGRQEHRRSGLYTDRAQRKVVADNARYRYYRSGGGWVIAVWSPFTLDTIVYACAFCSPEDQFNRKTGRYMALDRLLSYPTQIPVDALDEQVEARIAARTTFYDPVSFRRVMRGRKFK